MRERVWQAGAGAIGVLCLVVLGATGCECGRRPVPRDADLELDTGPPGLDAPGLDAPPLDAPRPDAPLADAPLVLDPDAACGRANVEVAIERLPVDIVWMVDNSTSMAPAIAEVQSGMNTFADTLLASGLDYRLILLSLRGSGAITFMGSNRYGICIPTPLAGAGCADGARFFQVPVDVRSTMPVEQLLGTLAQTTGYQAGDAVGSAAWRPLLRPGATRTIVVVTDDNSRTCDRPNPGGSCDPSDAPLTPTSLLDYPGGGNPFTSTRALGPGLLDPSYSGLFDGVVFDAVYGYGSDTDPDAVCTYPGGSSPPAAGHTYTALVTRTGGVRAHICDGAAAWGPFFDAVATGVVRSSRIECEVALPPPPDGMSLDARLVNVSVRSTASGSSTALPYVGSAAACDATRGGWYYDSFGAPTRIFLCPASCDFARAETAGGGGLDVLFGCESIVF